MADADGTAADLEIAETFANIARLLLAEKSLSTTLDRICVLAVETVPGCEHASISIVHGPKIETEASTSELPCRVDAIQYETNSGPCLDAIRDHELFETDDLSLEARWPDFSQRTVEETGVHSMLSLRLFAEAETMGALNLYSCATAAFDVTGHAVGSVFAAHAAVAMVDARTKEQLEEALRSRDVIGRAKGILMARENISDDEAFDLLRRASQRMNIKLRDVAARLAEPTTGPAE